MVAEVSRHPPSQVLNLDNLPRYAGYACESTARPPRSRFPCLTSIPGQIIYYLTRVVPGGQITQYFGYTIYLGSMQRDYERHGIIEVLSVKVGVSVLLILASIPDCSQNQTAVFAYVSDALRFLFDF